MSHPGLTFALFLGVAIGTAIYYYFKNENPRQVYEYNDPNQEYCNPVPPVPASTLEGCDTHPSTKRRRNSTITPKCSICLDSLKGTKIKKISCGHIFHDNCITMWFRTSLTCPNCRSEEHL